MMDDMLSEESKIAYTVINVTVSSQREPSSKVTRINRFWIEGFHNCGLDSRLDRGRT
jgi:hypothetical protein